MAQLFQPRSILYLKLLILAVLVMLAATYLLWHYSFQTMAPIAEPVSQDPPFSHKHHVSDIGLDCRFCHVSVETSAFAGIPPTATCMRCHSQLFRSQGMLQAVQKSFREDRPLQWVRVHKLPDFVYFNHSIHIAKGIGCSSCHGQVDQMPLMWRTQSLRMGWCLSCHRHPEQFVRAKDQVLNMAWQPPADQIERGLQLLAAYQVDVRRLTDCSNCHR